MEIKKRLRQEARRRRDALPARMRRLWSEEICRHLLRWEIFQEAQSIYFYYPLGSEADLLAAAQRALELGKCVAFPRTLGETMEFYPVKSLDMFREGPFHVMEPVGREPLRDSSPLILTPGLAFDRQGGRIGYGRAYYDRYFQRFPQAYRVGVCFEAQLVEQIPVEAHDCFMDDLMTDRGRNGNEKVGIRQEIKRGLYNSNKEV